MTSMLEAILSDGEGAAVLSCLEDADPLSVSQLSARTWLSVAAARRAIGLLESFDLVEETDDLDSESEW